jgi:ABC-2 type transport system permease protein
MNTQSNAIPDSFDSPGVTPAAMSPTRPMYWSVRRELWENRSIYLAPAVVAGVTLFGFLISTIGLPAKMRAALALDPLKQHAAIVSHYHFAAAMIMLTALIVAIFYCLDALYGERRDRSILFWKSLPVSDLTTVLAKASVPLVILPLLAFAITVAVQLIMLLVSSAVLAGSGLSVTTLWTQLALFQMSLMLLYHLVTVHVLWHAPIYSWLLLVSAWARRVPFLWAILPPLAIVILEKIAFNTSHFAAMLEYRLRGGAEAMGFPGRFPIDPGMQLTPGKFLSSPGLWIGLIIAAAFLAAAARLRRYRGPI